MPQAEPHLGGVVRYGRRRFADLGELRRWLFADDDGHESWQQLEADRNEFTLLLGRTQV